MRKEEEVAGKEEVKGIKMARERSTQAGEILLNRKWFSFG